MVRVDTEDIRARHRLGHVAGRMGLGVPKMTGKLMICCPLPEHSDHTPSMRLDLDADHFHCFGCGAHGDVIGFVEGVYGVGFRAAVAMLEAPGGLPVAPGGAPAVRHPVRVAARGGGPEPGRSTPAELLAVLEDAWRYYCAPTRHDVAVSYLARRHIDVHALEAEIGHAVVGHSGAGIASLYRHLYGLGHRFEAIIDAGLARRFHPKRPPTDVYRDRLVLPVRDKEGQVLGFLGRDTAAREGAAKYLNPPHTALYDKSRCLYRPTMVASSLNSRVVVVEGPLDALAIAAKAATIRASEMVLPVSASGTAVSDTQWDTILGRTLTAVVLAADGDDAGRQANARWSAQLVKRGHPHEIVTWPEGADPASYLADHELDTCLTIPISEDHRRMRPGARGPRRVLRAIPGHSRSLVSEEAPLATSMATSMSMSMSTSMSISTSTSISPFTHGYLSIGA